MAKRIQMRKNRFLALQKMAEQKKNEAMNASNAAMNDGGPPDHHGIPKQTVSLFRAILLSKSLLIPLARFSRWDCQDLQSARPHAHSYLTHVSFAASWTQ